MEDDSHATLKCRFSSTPANTLNDPCRQILAKLDIKQALPSDKGHSRDYRGLAGLMGFRHDELRRFERYENCTMKILESWEISPDATVGKLIGYLEDMDRRDIIEDLIPFLNKSIAEYQKPPVQVNEVASSPMNVHSNRKILTRDDLRNGDCTMYDAYLCYDDRDRRLVFGFAEKLENPAIGLKLFIKARDLLAGHLELESDTELIMNRCRRMLMMLTPNFVKNPMIEFLVNFASYFSVERNRRRILIPVVLESCERLPIIRNVTPIDFTDKYLQNWTWENLITSILPEDETDFVIPSVERNPLRNLDVISNSAHSALQNAGLVD